MSYLVVSLVAGLTAVQVVHRARKRGRLLRAGLYVGAVVLLLAWMLGEIPVGSRWPGRRCWWTAVLRAGEPSRVRVTGVVAAMLVERGAAGRWRGCSS